jgi:hypothetical protein
LWFYMVSYANLDEKNNYRQPNKPKSILV